MKFSIIVILVVAAAFARAQVPMEVVAKNAVSGTIGSSKVEKVEVVKITGGELDGKYNLIIYCVLPQRYYNNQTALLDARQILAPLSKRFTLDKTFDDMQMITVVAHGKKEPRVVLNISLWREDVESINWNDATPESIIKTATKRGYYKPL